MSATESRYSRGSTRAASEGASELMRPFWRARTEPGRRRRFPPAGRSRMSRPSGPRTERRRRAASRSPSPRTSRCTRSANRPSAAADRYMPGGRGRPREKIGRPPVRWPRRHRRDRWRAGRQHADHDVVAGRGAAGTGADQTEQAVRQRLTGKRRPHEGGGGRTLTRRVERAGVLRGLEGSPSSRRGRPGRRRTAAAQVDQLDDLGHPVRERGAARGQLRAQPQQVRREQLDAAGGQAEGRGCTTRCPRRSASTSADCPRWTMLIAPRAIHGVGDAASTRTLRGIVVRDDAVILGIVGRPTGSRVSPHRTAFAGQNVRIGQGRAHDCGDRA